MNLKVLDILLDSDDQKIDHHTVNHLPVDWILEFDFLNLIFLFDK
jgi:hypothetical protein